MPEKLGKPARIHVVAMLIVRTKGSLLLVTFTRSYEPNLWHSKKYEHEYSNITFTGSYMRLFCDTAKTMSKYYGSSSPENVGYMERYQSFLYTQKHQTNYAKFKQPNNKHVSLQLHINLYSWGCPVSRLSESTSCPSLLLFISLTSKTNNLFSITFTGVLHLWVKSLWWHRLNICYSSISYSNQYWPLHFIGQVDKDKLFLKHGVTLADLRTICPILRIKQSFEQDYLS